MLKALLKLVLPVLITEGVARYRQYRAETPVSPSSNGAPDVGYQLVYQPDGNRHIDFDPAKQYWFSHPLWDQPRRTTIAGVEMMHWPRLLYHPATGNA